MLDHNCSSYDHCTDEGTDDKCWYQNRPLDCFRNEASSLDAESESGLREALQKISWPLTCSDNRRFVPEDGMSTKSNSKDDPFNALACTKFDLLTSKIPLPTLFRQACSELGKVTDVHGAPKRFAILKMIHTLLRWALETLVQYSAKSEYKDDSYTRTSFTPGSIEYPCLACTIDSVSLGYEHQWVPIDTKLLSLGMRQCVGDILAMQLNKKVSPTQANRTDLEVSVSDDGGVETIIESHQQFVVLYFQTFHTFLQCFGQGIFIGFRGDSGISDSSHSDIAPPYVIYDTLACAEIELRCILEHQCDEKLSIDAQSDPLHSISSPMLEAICEILIYTTEYLCDNELPFGLPCHIVSLGISTEGKVTHDYAQQVDKFRWCNAMPNSLQHNMVDILIRCLNDIVLFLDAQYDISQPNNPQIHCNQQSPEARTLRKHQDYILVRTAQTILTSVTDDTSRNTTHPDGTNPTLATAEHVLSIVSDCLHQIDGIYSLHEDSTAQTTLN